MPQMAVILPTYFFTLFTSYLAHHLPSNIQSISSNGLYLEYLVGQMASIL